MAVSGQNARVWFTGANGQTKLRHAIVMEVHPSGGPLIALVIVGMGFQKTSVPNVCVDAQQDRHWFGMLELTKTTYFHEDDVRYYAVNAVQTKPTRCPPKLFLQLRMLIEPRLLSGGVIDFNHSLPHVPEASAAVYQVAGEHRVSKLAPLESEAAVATDAKGAEPAE